LLKIARRTLGAVVAKKAPPRFEPEEPNLNDRRGVFVTLKNNGRLRGCIGYIMPVKPLFQAVQEMALQAACHDSRFSPVRADELKELSIEISVLSRLRRIGNVSEVRLGSDGLYIINGESSGLLLPQVAVEQGWERAEFLKQVCLKAGLPEDAWRDQATTLYRFTAEVFWEPD
jgi:AmmeMemoRadiSam system protein A